MLGDDISLYLCDESCEKVVTAFPLIRSKQIAEHMPFMGIRGMDYLLEAVDRYIIPQFLQYCKSSGDICGDRSGQPCAGKAGL